MGRGSVGLVKQTPMHDGRNFNGPKERHAILTILVAFTQAPTLPPPWWHFLVRMVFVRTPFQLYKNCPAGKPGRVNRGDRLAGQAAKAYSSLNSRIARR